MTLGEMLHTQTLRDPEATALFCGDEKISYGDLDESSSLLACWLLEQGLQRGDRVAIHRCNSIETVQVFFAAFKAGLIAVPVNLRMKPPEVAWILEHSQSAICFCQPSLAHNVEQAASGSFRAVLTALPELITGRASALPLVGEDEPAVLLYTSGSTSKPKGAIHTHRTLGEAIRLMVENMLDPNDVVLIMTSMMHATGLGCLLSAIRLGRPAVLLLAFDPAATLDAIERFGCTFALGLPALLQFVVEEQVGLNLAKAETTARYLPMRPPAEISVKIHHRAFSPARSSARRPDFPGVYTSRTKGKTAWLDARVGPFRAPGLHLDGTEPQIRPAVARAR